MMIYDKAEKLKEVLGVEELLNEILQTLNPDELDDVVGYIARMYDIEFEEE